MRPVIPVTILFGAILAVSILSTASLIMMSIGLPLHFGTAGPFNPIQPTESQVIAQGFFDQSYVIAPASWILLSGVWIWRGKIRSKWNSSGYTQDAFDLLVKMKGGPTRLKLLQALNAPKDRSKLAQELGIDWKAVDRHVQILQRYNFIKQDSSYGQVVLYTITPDGEKLLQLIQELDSEGTTR
jgi:predicted transcriptional regulator